MNRQSSTLANQSHDIQAMLASGFGQLTSSCFWLLSIRDAALAREWLRTVIRERRIKSVADLAQGVFDEAVTIAFSSSGLSALGLKESEEFPFPTPFRSGMGSKLRRGILRDPDRDDWRWSDVPDGPQRPMGVDQAATSPAAHLLVARWWKSGAAEMAAPDPKAFECVGKVQGCPGFFDGDKLTEPFGFRDGLSQPIVRGLKGEKPDESKQTKPGAGGLSGDHLIAPGEFILGYRNEYDQLTYLPDLRDRDGQTMKGDGGGRFSLNGSYLAVRQIEQDVKAFKQLRDQQVPTPDGSGQVSVAEKLMGRHFDGRPISIGANPAAPGSDPAANAFRFRAGDANGLACPMGSHIRRVNPRDSLGADAEAGLRSSKLHRLLRRGRPYREQAGATEGPGLLFLACNADLERQFEFVLQRWLHNPRFAGLEDQDDPVIGAAADARQLSLPNLPVGTRLSLKAYTRTLGGGYFFLPGLEALRFIAR